MHAELSEEDYKKVWGELYQRYNFEPSVDPKKWPGIDEPGLSITISLSENYYQVWPNVLIKKDKEQCWSDARMG